MNSEIEEITLKENNKETNDYDNDDKMWYCDNYDETEENKINCNTIDENQKGLNHEVDLKMEEIFVEDITYN